MAAKSVLVTLFYTVVATSVLAEAQSLKGKKLTVTSILEAPFLTLVNSNETLVGNERFEGYIVDLIVEVATDLGFDYEIKLVPDNRYGGLVRNGTWTGMVKELIDKRADMAAAPLTVTTMRSMVIDFTVPFMNAGPVIVMKKPSARYSPNVWERVLRPLFPFGDMVWLTIFIAYLVTGFFLYVVSYCNPYEWRKLSHDGLATVREAESFTCMNTYWFLLSTITWQGFVRAPRSLGGRLIAGFWWLFVVFSLITYTGALTNFLRVFREEYTFTPPVRNFKELAFSPLQVGAVESGATQAYFVHSKIPIFHRIGEKLRASDESFPSVASGMNKVMNDQDFVFLMESKTAEYITSQNCDLMHTEDRMSPYFLAIGLQKDWPYRTQINTAMLKLRERGGLDRLRNRWLHAGICDYSTVISQPGHGLSTTESFIQVDIATFSGVLILLAIGIVAGCLVTAVEFCIFKIAEKNEEDVVQEPQPVQVKKESDV